MDERVDRDSPYKAGGLWVFDDPAVGLTREPFVSGADAIIDRLVQEIPDAKSGFTLLFSAQPFPGFQAEFEWRGEEFSGNWYYSPALGMEGWLCPALLKYFDCAPKRIYAQFRAKAFNTLKLIRRADTGNVLGYFATGLFALACLAGCVATDINSTTEGASSSPRSGGQVNAEPNPEASKISNHTDPPNITYRPGR